jgi:formylglycine-generating enzyme required for sulfatase activity
MGASNDHLVPGNDPTWHRLVVVSPFWLETHEVTAGDARARGFQTGITPWTGSNSGSIDEDWCTYGMQPQRRDQLPLDCIVWPGAQAFCKDLGGELPTEAQFEYAAGGAIDTPYPWGFEVPGCGDAIWGRNGFGYHSADLPYGCLGPVDFLEPLGGPEPPGHGALDALDLPGGPIVDLAGNVAELTGDVYQATTEGCWSTPGVLRDPSCATPSRSGPAAHALRAGGWSSGYTFVEAAARVAWPDEAYATDVGFRCAWKDR